jgi:tetratricopeptide (TPR) repeat protein
VNPLLAFVSVAGLALVAAAGVVAGYRRREPLPVEPFADPLEDRRVALLRSLSDLEDAHATGVLDDEDYRRLRGDTEGRMARLLRAIDERRLRAERGREGLAPAPASVGEAAAVRVRAPGRVPPWAVATLLAATVGAVVLAGLLRDTEAAPGASGAIAGSEDPFAFFENRVREHPDDLAARLDLAHRYLDAGRIEESLAEYAVALELDPDGAEAHANVGLILFLSDRPRQALASVDRALETSPDYPEALFFRGVILLRGLDRPADAIGSLERYLDSAPFGAERDTAQDLIDEARAALAGDA